MEQQTVSIAKAGIIATLNARTSILASANPVESRYNPKLSVVENLQLPPTLLSRFDLIYLVLDSERPDADRQLAAHLVSLFQDPSERSKRSAPYSVAELTEYISFAKSNVAPRISDEGERAQALGSSSPPAATRRTCSAASAPTTPHAVAPPCACPSRPSCDAASPAFLRVCAAARGLIVAGYLDMRRAGLRGGQKTITATTRQLESIIRLSEGRARMRLAEEVAVEDVEEAIRLINVSTHRAAMDPRTGQINMDLLTTGHS